MCDPASMTALTIASTMAQLRAQQMQANAAANANDAQAKNIIQASNANQAQANLEQSQAAAAAAQKINANDLAAQRAAATTLTTAGESGISGRSVGDVLADLAGKQSDYNGSVETNYSNEVAGINAQRTNIGNSAASAMNSLKTPQQPDYLGAGLQIASSVYKYKNPK